MLPKNRPQLSVRIIRVKNLNGEDHYRLRIETPDYEEFTIAQWSCRGTLPPRMLEDIQATLSKAFADHVPLESTQW
jgi:hypothetical protein